MSLFSMALEPFTVLDKTTTSDGYGGMINTWTDGAIIQATASLDVSTQAKIGAVQGLTSVYTVFTNKSVNLQFHDVIRRNRDGKVFRITSDGDDKATPSSASLDMRVVSAEEWVIPNG